MPMSDIFSKNERHIINWTIPLDQLSFSPDYANNPPILLRSFFITLFKKGMLISCLLFVWLIVSINGFERNVYEQKLSSVDAELISFANLSLAEYFRYDPQIRPTHI